MITKRTGPDYLESYRYTNFTHGKICTGCTRFTYGRVWSQLSDKFYQSIATTARFHNRASTARLLLYRVCTTNYTKL